MNTPFRPYRRDELLLERMNESGLILVRKYFKGCYKAKVLCAGRSTGMKPGDVVYVGRFAGLEMDWYGKEYILVKDSELMAMEVPHGAA